MAQMFADEAKLPDNNARNNFVFMAYPFKPPLAQDDYRKAVKELQEKLPVRFWYFLDEITTDELMRKVWRAILRSDLSVFDISDGNANVALELGLAIAKEKRCMTMLMKGKPNPLGGADLGYSERVEYESITTLKAKLEGIVESKSSALKQLREISFKVIASDLTQPQAYDYLLRLVGKVFRDKSVNKRQGVQLLDGDTDLFYKLVFHLREGSVFEVEGEKKGAKYIFTSSWVHSDYAVTGE